MRTRHSAGEKVAFGEGTQHALPRARGVGDAVIQALVAMGASSPLPAGHASSTPHHQGHSQQQQHTEGRQQEGRLATQAADTSHHGNEAHSTRSYGASNSSRQADSQSTTTAASHHDQQPVVARPTFTTVFMSKATANARAIRATLCNEGPIKLKPAPKDAVEFEDRYTCV